MNCLLCNNLISIYDTSAGCQDPSRSYPECDRLTLVVEDVVTPLDGGNAASKKASKA